MKNSITFAVTVEIHKFCNLIGNKGHVFQTFNRRAIISSSQMSTGKEGLQAISPGRGHGNLAAILDHILFFKEVLQHSK